MKWEIGNGVWHIADTFEAMASLPDASVDMVLADLPYGTTACSWDSVLPLDALWREYWRICKPSAAIVLTAAQPFTTALIASNFSDFKYCWAWNKVLATGHLNAKKQPLRAIEDVAVFYAAQPTYNPIKTIGHKRKIAHTRYEREGVGEQAYGRENRDTHYDSTERYPTTLLTVSNAAQRGKTHPTQKPVALFEYLIRTYTQPSMTVLDNTAGSGTTAIAAENAGRRWICIERDVDYSMAAIDRISRHLEG